MIKTSPSLNEITTLIASQLDRELDDPFKRSLGLRVDFWRATLVSRSLDKHQQQRAFFRQTLWVPMQPDKGIDCNVAFPVCPVARSKYKIPTPMRIGNTLFDYVGTVDGAAPFRISAPGTSMYVSAGKYSKNATFYEYTNGYIYVTSNSKLPMIRVDYVADDPMQVMEMNCKNGTDCDYWIQPYPCTYDIIQMIIQYIIQVDYNRQNVPNIPEIEINPLVPRNKNEP
jgi:hypothetical protein